MSDLNRRPSPWQGDVLPLHQWGIEEMEGFEPPCGMVTAHGFQDQSVKPGSGTSPKFLELREGLEPTKCFHHSFADCVLCRSDSPQHSYLSRALGRTRTCIIGFVVRWSIQLAYESIVAQEGLEPSRHSARAS